jgi:hypothetical protein
MDNSNIILNKNQKINYKISQDALVYNIWVLTVLRR